MVIMSKRPGMFGTRSEMVRWFAWAFAILLVLFIVLYLLLKWIF